MQWTEQLATHIEQIDEQHQGLFDCLAELENAIKEGSVLYAVYATTRLRIYVRDHFTAEEKMMRRNNYPDLEQHIAEHQAFRDRLEDLTQRSVREDVSLEMVDFLSGWLANHIGKVDMQYVPYVSH
jgi:hemerythrin